MDKSTKEALTKLLWNFTNELKESCCNTVIKMSMTKSIALQKGDLEKLVSILKSISSENMSKDYVSKISKLLESK